jgi:hypothetical protein
VDTRWRATLRASACLSSRALRRLVWARTIGEPARAEDEDKELESPARGGSAVHGGRKAGAHLEEVEEAKNQTWAVGSAPAPRTPLNFQL